MALDLDGVLLRSFVQAARLGSVGRAARALGRTQPAVSLQIRRLEDLLGCKLLTRSPRGIGLTPDGELFLPFAERILELSSEAADRLGSGRTQVSLGVVEELAESAALHATLLAWRTRWPDLQMNLHIQSGAALHAAFEAGRLDLLVADPLIRDGAPRPLWRREVRLVWAALPGFDAAARPLALALYPPPCQWRDRVVQALELAGVRFRVAVQSGGLSAMRAAAGSGLALAAMLPMSVTPGLVVVPHQSVELPLAPSIEIACYQKRRGDRRLDEVQAMLEGVLIAHG